MVFLIGGETHTGKTLLAQQLLERFHIPYLSLDHLKMGLIRGMSPCPFTPESPEDTIADQLWPILKGMIDVCLENGQNQAFEGCYLPPERIKPLLGQDVAALYLIFSENYLWTHYDLVLQYENTIEHRLTAGAPAPETMIAANSALKQRCLLNNIPFLEISTDHSTCMAQAVQMLGRHMVNLRSYRPADLPAVCRLFYETVHTSCAGDYSTSELDAWAPEKVDLANWNHKLRESLCVVAVAGGEIIGFATLAGDILDHLYVHTAWQRRGVGSRMVLTLESAARKRGHKTIFTDASVTSRPFFLSMGYRILTPQQVVKNGISLTNYRMCKAL